MLNLSGGRNGTRELSMDELSKVVGGTAMGSDYATAALQKAFNRFQQLIREQVPPDSARQQAIQEYWAEVVNACRANPEPNGCSPEEQARVLFALTLGM